jgi:hypothetical protein
MCGMKQMSAAHRPKTKFVMAKFRHLSHQHIKKAFLTQGVEELLAQLSVFPVKTALHSVLSALYSTNEAVRFKSVTLFGLLMSKLAQEDMEAARQVMRRLMWSLNDESGGIGWGAPEAMAEAMAMDAGLAQEYAHILLSYVWEEGNYLEYLPLRRGALKGIARLACARPQLLNALQAQERLQPYLNDADEESREAAQSGLACLRQAK